MSNQDDSGPAGGSDDLLAAEYVLGVLTEDERLAVAARLQRDGGFASLVERWEAHLAPLAEAYGAVEPPASLKQAIDRRLFPAVSRPAPVTAASGVWQSLGFWRGLAAAALAALSLLAVLPFLDRPGPSPQRLVASLSAEGSDVRYLAVYDAAGGEVALRHLSGERAAGSDFELWMIEGTSAPVSMGVIPASAAVRLPLPAGVRGGLESGEVLAVSVEPAGGSPTGQPTGAVVAMGSLESI